VREASSILGSHAAHTPNVTVEPGFLSVIGRVIARGMIVLLSRRNPQSRDDFHFMIQLFLTFQKRSEGSTSFLYGGRSLGSDSWMK
jgi:hypothetical protein